jgi:purine nucleosidase
MTRTATPTPVWIDTDMGFDDLAAVLVVDQDPGWQVEGLSLVAGNAPLPVVESNALRSAACFGWRFPVHAGCDKPLACDLVTAQYVLGEDAMASAGRQLPAAPAGAALASRDAVGALARWLETASAPATVLALGPLTNVASLLIERPDLASRIGRLVWMGGSAGPGNHTAAAEFNAAVDPESVQRVIDTGVCIEMVGLDACRQVRAHAADADALRALGTERSAILADLLLGYVRIASPDGSRPMALYDPTAAAALVCPEGMQWREGHLAMELDGTLTRGMTVVEWRVPRKAIANARIASLADEEKLRDVVFGALARAAR